MTLKSGNYESNAIKRERNNFYSIMLYKFQNYANKHTIMQIVGTTAIVNSKIIIPPPVMFGQRVTYIIHISFYNQDRFHCNIDRKIMT